MANIKICDWCGKDITNSFKPDYTIKRFGVKKLDMCYECMNKFCEHTGLKPLYREPISPRTKGVG